MDREPRRVWWTEDKVGATWFQDRTEGEEAIAFAAVERSWVDNEIYRLESENGGFFVRVLWPAPHRPKWLVLTT